LNEIPDFVDYYNPIYNEFKTNEPVASLCYEIANKKEDLWIAVLGCIADKYIPSYYQEFLKNYPDLGIESENAFDILYGSEIGKIARMVGAGLKDRTMMVMKMVRFLIKVKTPYEVLEEKIENHEMHKRFDFIDTKLKKYLNKAREEYSGGNLLFFKYSGEISMSADIANRLSHEFPGIILIVAFIKGSRVNISVRGKNVREKILGVLKEFPLSSGGGHEDAVGAQIDLDQVDEFKKRVEEVFG